MAVGGAADRPPLLPALRRLRRARRAVLHPGRPHRTAEPSETGRPIPYIDQVAIDFPELTIVCGHIGYPWTEEMVAVARKHERVYIDTSAYTARRYPPELVAYMRTGGGSRKVMFGSNHPMIAPQQALEHLQSLKIDDETQELFLHANAERVFDL